MLDASDRDLSLRARRGEPEAFGELVRRYQVSVYNVCLRLLGDRREAEDMAQEAFVRAYQRFGTFDPGRPFGPWVRRVAANVCLNRMQRAQPPSVALDDERDDLPAGGPADPEAAHEQAEAAQRLRQALLQLPPRYRAVIELRHFQEMNYEAIGEALGLPLSDVKSHLFRARRMLADVMRKA